jgi:NhaA family Na+:H+ antiporter
MAGFDDTHDLDGLRAPWVHRPIARRIFQPLQTFLAEEASSGILLLGATVAALLWVNSPWGDTYERFWSVEAGIRWGDWRLFDDLRQWVNDGLMTLFFLVVGLEIKREFTTGELRNPRVAAVPMVAAVGGMVVPALLYFALNTGGEGARGWAIPMATDIAFALGVLTLAAKKAPVRLKPFLLTLAIVDDIGAIVVIAVFYSVGIEAVPLLVSIGLLALIVGLQRIHVRATPVYILIGAGVWLALLESGVNPTLAGVVLGLLTPSEPFQRPRAVSREAHRIAEETVDEPFPPDADAPQWLRLAELSREAVSPLARVESALHPWTSSLVIPLFALANAGVVLSRSGIREAFTSPVAVGVFLGLVVGKVAGITLASLGAVRLGLGRLPEGAGTRELVGTGAVAGIGFTVSLFVTELAFTDPLLVDTAKIGILTASVVAGVFGLFLLRTHGRAGQLAGMRRPVWRA